MSQLLKSPLSTLSILLSLSIVQSTAIADTFNYTAGVICVGRTSLDESKLERRRGSLFNKSTTDDAQVYCSAPAVDFATRTKVRLVVNARQGSARRGFKGAFGLYHPTTGKQLVGKLVTLPSTPNNNVKFGPTKLLTTKLRSAFNQVQVWIPPRSSIYSVYAKYTSDASTPTTTRPEAFAWANLPDTNVSYLAPANFSYNSTGATNRIRRLSVGRYEVTFPGVGGTASSVQVTAQGTPGVQCQTGGWNRAANVVVTVSCYDATGAATNAKFTVAYRGA